MHLIKAEIKCIDSGQQNQTQNLIAHKTVFRKCNFLLDPELSCPYYKNIAIYPW